MTVAGPKRAVGERPVLHTNADGHAPCTEEACPSRSASNSSRCIRRKIGSGSVGRAPRALEQIILERVADEDLCSLFRTHGAAALAGSR